MFTESRETSPPFCDQRWGEPGYSTLSEHVSARQPRTDVRLDESPMRARTATFGSFFTLPRNFSRALSIMGRAVTVRKSPGGSALSC